MTCNLFEVGPRDGLQSEPKVLGIEDRFSLVVALAEAGIRNIEVGSFVRADRIPQLASSDDLVAKLILWRKNKNLKKTLKFWAFVPNDRGLEDAIAAQVDGVSFFIAASDTFAQKNVGKTTKELLVDLKALLPKARKNKLKTRVYLSTLVHCPYEGQVKSKKIKALCENLLDLGAAKVVLSDTTGAARPEQVRKICSELLHKESPRFFALHCHDTRGLALANVIAAHAEGFEEFDSSIGGLGGCPYAPGASGNLATEDLVNWMKESSLAREINVSKLLVASRIAERLSGHELNSKALKYFRSLPDGSK